MFITYKKTFKSYLRICVRPNFTHAKPYKKLFTLQKYTRIENQIEITIMTDKTQNKMLEFVVKMAA